MSQHRCRNCLHCEENFQPDPRSNWCQKYCSKPECRKASKAASQRQWLSKSDNQDYFKGHENVQRVREWRKEHPEYWKKQHALQDDCVIQHDENKSKLPILDSSALQDILTTQHFVLIGLIATLTGNTLQDDIAQSTKRFMELGRDILSSPNGSKDQHHNGNKDMREK